MTRSFFVVFLILISGKLSSQNRTPDTCACNSLFKAWDIYRSSSANPTLEYDSVAGWMLGLPCSNCENVLHLCRQAFIAGQNHNRFMLTDELPNGLSVWNPVSHSVLTQYMTDYYYQVPDQLTCEATKVINDRADPYTVRLWLENYFNQHTSSRKLKIDRLDGPEKYIRLLQLSRANWNRKYKNIFTRLETEINSAFEPESGIPLGTYFSRTILSYYLWRPDCLNNASDIVRKTLCTVFKADTSSDIEQLRNEYLGYFLARDTNKLNLAENAVHKTNTECTTGYKMPLVWYLFQSDSSNAIRPEKDTQSFTDTGLTDALSQLLNTVNLKPQNDYLFTRSFYLYPENSGHPNDLSRNFDKAQQLWPKADRKQLKWTLEVSDNKDPFSGGFSINISDSLKKHLHLTITLPQQTKRHALPYLAEINNLKVISHSGAKYIFTAEFVFEIKINPQSPEFQQTAMQANHYNQLFLLPTVLVDFVTVLIELDTYDN